MEFYQRVKQKLADEIEGDSPLEYPEGNGSNDVESLKQEIEELKHHLNSNYTVYTRRLEKSKAKRKDLEACLREVTTENERLAREADQAEGIYFFPVMLLEVFFFVFNKQHRKKRDQLTYLKIFRVLLAFLNSLRKVRTLLLK